MKCSKRSVAAVSVFVALLLSSSTGTLRARDADPASHTFAAAQTAKTAMHKYLPCTISRLPVQKTNTFLRVSECFPRLQPPYLQWSNRLTCSLPPSVDRVVQATSLVGTFETCRPMRPMSVLRVRPEVFVVSSKRRS